LLAVQEGMLDVIHLIRETCNELRPPFIKEHGIVNLLEHLFTHAQLNTNFTINFDATKFTVALDYDPLLTIYRIVQELLTNATNHSRATKLDIILANKDGVVTLIYRDNGIGVSLEAFQSSFQHMGLSGIQERIASLEGTRQQQAMSSSSSPERITTSHPVRRTRLLSYGIMRDRSEMRSKCKLFSFRPRSYGDLGSKKYLVSSLCNLKINWTVT
jgi:signal transduction histidine kinase